jgi:hypothetical protein
LPNHLFIAVTINVMQLNDRFARLAYLRQKLPYQVGGFALPVGGLHIRVVQIVVVFK